MNERTFGREFLLGLDLFAESFGNIHGVQIPDSTPLPGKRAVQPKRYDLGILFGGKYFGVEHKSVKNGWSFGANKLPNEHQQRFLDQVDAGGGLAVVCVHFWIDKVSAARLKKGWPKKIDRAFLVPWRILKTADLPLPLEWWERSAEEIQKARWRQTDDKPWRRCWDPRLALAQSWGNEFGDVDLLLLDFKPVSNMEFRSPVGVRSES